ncbi:glutamate racemase [Bordetella genomosp. 8]|uniref:Glutamate racemase n=1 Tax=Bordetella genomosp. 8 TaxID=1416806 RepID=A0A1W6YKC6_9BORD|nr:glutamate racemase [Bordetella genomosp. 8]
MGQRPPGLEGRRRRHRTPRPGADPHSETGVPAVNDAHPGCYLGILGGMGPMAGAAFALRLAALTPADRDQDHIPAVLLNDPRVPDRTAATRGGEDPLPYLLRGIRFLNDSGARLIAIPCNTAHLWYEQMVQASRAPVLHIIESVVEDLHRRGIREGRIGLMGTEATLRLGLYQRTLERHGYECIVPSEDEQVAYCTKSILAVKANRLAEAYEPAAACVRLLESRGAVAVALGCTELPLAIPHDRRMEFDVPMTDSIDALALAVIQRYQAE